MDIIKSIVRRYRGYGDYLQRKRSVKLLLFAKKRIELAQSKEVRAKITKDKSKTIHPPIYYGGIYGSPMGGMYFASRGSAKRQQRASAKNRNLRLRGA